MPPKQPDLPLPAHPDVDSMLSRKFGREVANYFSGSPLNRLGFLRADHVFLGRALKHPSTSFMLCKDLQPLVQSSDNKKLKYVKFEDVKGIIGERTERLASGKGTQYTTSRIQRITSP